MNISIKREQNNARISSAEREKFGAKLKTKNIFKVLALAMLMPATMLNTACSNDDDLAANNNEITNKKGFEIPVTINVTRQGDATTRATFDDGTKKLSFSASDKLFVFSYDGGSAGVYAGVLDWVSGGKFSGNLYTQNKYEGTVDALLSGGDPATAVLLPAGYGGYGYLSTEGNSGSYSDGYTEDYTKAFVASTTEKTAKALAVEQLSCESATYKSGGFALEPNNAILSFTITGLTASTNVTATIKKGEDVLVSGSVTTDGSGNATFAMGIQCAIEINPLTLTVGGKEITITSTNTVFEAGKIYNITRSAAPATDLSTISANYTAQNGETLTGTLTNNVKISIANGATVTLKNVNISGTNDDDYKWAGITCAGDATITLEGTNTVKGFYDEYPGIYVPEGNTVTINGSGSLTASSNGWGAGIGGGWEIACGNIEIQGGTITATGGKGAAGIGSGGGGDNVASCGTITISGGTVTATGGKAAAGIGTGEMATCGSIRITGGTVTAQGGNNAAGIGCGQGSFSIKSECGAITIEDGGNFTSVTAIRGQYAQRPIGHSSYDSDWNTCGTITFGYNTVYTAGDVLDYYSTDDISGLNFEQTTTDLGGGEDYTYNTWKLWR